MPESFPKPRFKFEYTLSPEVTRLRQHRETRGVPSVNSKNLLLATWNIANFGGQDRGDDDHKIIAEILSWFDVVAIQEVKENFEGLFDVLDALGSPYRTVFSDVAGNNERMVYVYNAERVKLLEELGEVAFPVARIRKLKLKGVGQKFEGFDRSPYVATFQRGRVSFLLVNVHLFFGKEASKADMNRRALETFAVATYAADRRRSKKSFTREVVALGDFNMPKKAKGDPIYNALTAKGLMLPEHTSKVGSNLKGDKEYDQVAFFPGKTENCFKQSGVFDFDKVLFKALWDSRTDQEYWSYVRYYVSDHRPLWMELELP